MMIRLTTATLLLLAATSVQSDKDVVLPERISPAAGTDRCTTMIVGPKASADGSTMTTYTADCAECDFRIAKVPARDWPESSKRPVYLFASAYPRRVESGRSKTWDVSNLEDISQKAHWDDGFSKILGYIPQVNHTYALVEGLYGIMNEHQVSIGESTCSGRFFNAKPLSDGGNALFEIGELSSIALERCTTARCAIQTMGDLATEFGYYGAEWSGNIDNVIAEAGEALSVADTKEAWIFHILPDDTGKSAIWAAQRVPDDHITIVANQFIIRKIKKDDPDNFMYSKNLYEIAEKHDLWSEDDGDLDFLVSYGYLRTHSAYATRRVWRVFSLAAPSLNLPSETDDYGDNYPFSVKPDKPLTPADMMRYQRDHYEGTKYDLTQGVAAGPYGDPNRYDPAAVPDGNVTVKESTAGSFERSISLFRTSYSTVTQSRGDLPPTVGARFWFCQYMPAMSTYTPIYVSNLDLPDSYTSGSLFKYTKTCSYWASAAVGNWASRFYKYIRQDVEAEQRALEDPLFKKADGEETEALAMLATGDMNGAIESLQRLSHAAAKHALTTWNDLFEILIAKYRDGYKVKDLTAPIFAQEFLFYPLWWLKVAGFFYKSPTMPDPEPLPPGVKDGTSIEAVVVPEVANTSPPPLRTSRSSVPTSSHSSTSSILKMVFLVGTMCACSLALGFWLGKRMTLRQQYVEINV